MSKHHVFESTVSVANRWLKELMTTLQLPVGEEPRALHALRAGLHSIRDRLPANEVADLGAQLPTLIRGVYYDGWSLRSDPTRIRDRAAMLARVRKELGSDARLNAEEVLRAVIHLLAAHVSAGEIKDVISTLPRSIASLWEGVPAPKLTQHTGYSR